MAASETKVHVHLTGFGKFGGVERNVTADIVRKLSSNPRFLERMKNAGVKFTSSPPVVVARAEAEETVRTITRERDKGLRHVTIHLGVHGRTRSFLLERCAWNDASFRIPDERGDQVRHGHVVSSDAVVYRLHCVDCQP